MTLYDTMLQGKAAFDAGQPLAAPTHATSDLDGAWVDGWWHGYTVARDKQKRAAKRRINDGRFPRLVARLKELGIDARELKLYLEGTPDEPD